jgi:hypothetical protein
MLAVTLSIDGSLVALAASAMCVAYAVWPKEFAARVALVTGVTMFSGTLLAGGLLRDPGPGPQPAPDVAPVTGTLAETVTRYFTGTQAEAQELAALADQMSQQLIYDGTRAEPAIATTRALGTYWAQLQQYRFFADKTKFSDRFAELERALAADLTSRGILEASGKTAPLDVKRRALAASWFGNLAIALRGAGK